MTFSLLVRDPATGHARRRRRHRGALRRRLGAARPARRRDVGQPGRRALDLLGRGGARPDGGGQRGREALAAEVGARPRARLAAARLPRPRRAAPRRIRGRRTAPSAAISARANRVAAGNILAGLEALEVLIASYERGEGAVGARLIAALGAAQAAGGDRRGLSRRRCWCFDARAAADEPAHRLVARPAGGARPICTPAPPRAAMPTGCARCRSRATGSGPTPRCSAVGRGDPGRGFAIAGRAPHPAPPAGAPPPRSPPGYWCRATKRRRTRLRAPTRDGALGPRSGARATRASRARSPPGSPGRAVGERRGRQGLVPEGSGGDVVLQGQVAAVLLSRCASPAPGSSPAGRCGSGPDRSGASGTCRSAAGSDRCRRAGSPAAGRHRGW